MGDRSRELDFDFVLQAPHGYYVAVVGEDGAPEKIPLALLGYKHSKDTRFSSVWVATSLLRPYWEMANDHGIHSRNGSCYCGYPECRQLGVFSDGREGQMEELSAKRHEWLQKRAGRKEKAREARGKPANAE